MLIGIIGAGTMGKEVAQHLLVNCFSVILIDQELSIVEQAKEEIRRKMHMQKIMQNKEYNVSKAMQNLSLSDQITFLNDKKMDCIIENITEDITLKEMLYPKLNNVDEDCIFMVNTSCISITRIASMTNRPDKVIGVHFMNPVTMIHTVEVIKGFYTSEETINKTRDVLGQMSKTGIYVNDHPGFVSNRISHLMMNEAAFIVQDNVATPYDVDAIFKQCYGHKMGPLETADLIGLDTVVHSLKILYDSYQDPKFKCCPLLQKMVDAKLYGRKTGKGFYEY